MEDGNQVKNRGLSIFVEYYTKERRDACKIEMESRLSHILEQNQNDKYILEDYYEAFQAYKFGEYQVLEPLTKEHFSACITLSQALQSLIRCSKSRQVDLNSYLVRRWYGVMNYCRYNLSKQCNLIERSAKRPAQKVQCQRSRDCLSEVRKSIRTIDELNFDY